MEQIMHHLWKYQRGFANPLVTTEGEPVEVINPGMENHGAGPDFSNAVIKIGDTVWAGNVEIHEKASDWFRHNHEGNRLYDTVILHVVKDSDAEICRTTGEPIKQMVIQESPTVMANIDWLLYRDVSISCLEYIGRINPLYLSDWMGALLSERLERKTQDILTLFKHYKSDWNEAFYIILMRSFGFGLNSDAFEWLTKSIPYNCIRKHRNSTSQLEAMLLGQAGLLEENLPDHYYRLLQREYNFFRHKYGLAPLDASLFKSLRIRPAAFPPVKLAQLAALWSQHDTLFSMILDAASPAEIKKWFRVSPSDYWLTHYHFRQTTTPLEKRLSEKSINILLINAVIPTLFAYGKQHKRQEYCDRALRLLELIPPEQNQIITLFQKAGVSVENAGDTQALIQLKRNYCERKCCFFCRIGFRLIHQNNLL